jgi:hypothetical protein
MSRLRNEDGFTLMEVLTVMTVGIVLLGAILGLLESTVRLNTGVLAKTDAMQRGRLAMDSLTQQLRSQVCFDWNTSAIIQGSDANSVTFYSDFTAGGNQPVKRTLRFDQATGRILSLRYLPPNPLPNPFTPDKYPGTPTSINLVLENAARQWDPVKNQAVPFLRYFAYKDVGGVMKAEDELTPPLDDAEAARAARVEIAYVSRPTGAKDDKKAVNLSDQVMARHSDPNLAVPDPKCV